MREKLSYACGLGKDESSNLKMSLFSSRQPEVRGEGWPTFISLSSNPSALVASKIRILSGRKYKDILMQSKKFQGVTKIAYHYTKWTEELIPFTKKKNSRLPPQIPREKNFETNRFLLCLIEGTDVWDTIYVMGTLSRDKQNSSCLKQKKQCIQLFFSSTKTLRLIFISRRSFWKNPNKRSTSI